MFGGKVGWDDFIEYRQVKKSPVALCGITRIGAEL